MNVIICNFNYVCHLWKTVYKWYYLRNHVALRLVGGPVESLKVDPGIGKAFFKAAFSLFIQSFDYVSPVASDPVFINTDPFIEVALYSRLELDTVNQYVNVIYMCFFIYSRGLQIKRENLMFSVLCLCMVLWNKKK